MGTERVKFISTKYVKRNSTIEGNVDDDKIIPFIYKVQDIQLQQVLGSTFYYYLMGQIIAEDSTPGTLTVKENDLITDYIQPMVNEYVIFESIPFLNFKLTNKSVATENSENSNPSALNEIKYIRKTVQNMAEYYTKRLVTELDGCSNTDFPQYTDHYNDNVRPNNSSYSSGIYYPK